MEKSLINFTTKEIKRTLQKYWTQVMGGGGLVTKSCPWQVKDIRAEIFRGKWAEDFNLPWNVSKHKMNYWMDRGKDRWIAM